MFHSFSATLYRGQPQRTALTYILVSVEDVNDNAPIFSQVRPNPSSDFCSCMNQKSDTQEICTAAISEREGGNALVAQLRVEDRDSVNNGAEQLSFNIVNDQPMFIVEGMEDGGSWLVEVKTATGSVSVSMFFSA